VNSSQLLCWLTVCKSEPIHTCIHNGYERAQRGNGHKGAMFSPPLSVHSLNTRIHFCSCYYSAQLRTESRFICNFIHFLRKRALDCGWYNAFACFVLVLTVAVFSAASHTCAAMTEMVPPAWGHSILVAYVNARARTLPLTRSAPLFAAREKCSRFCSIYAIFLQHENRLRRRSGAYDLLLTHET
jgi:hypothetical protein